MPHCRQCGVETDARFRYCPWCATPQRSKLVEFFMGSGQDAGRALRVSRYLPERRVRFSVWDESGTARAAISLDEDESARLATYLTPSPPSKPSLLDELRALVRR